MGHPVHNLIQKLIQTLLFGSTQAFQTAFMAAKSFSISFSQIRASKILTEKKTGEISSVSIKESLILVAWASLFPTWR